MNRQFYSRNKTSTMQRKSGSQKEIPAPQQAKKNPPSSPPASPSPKKQDPIDRNVASCFEMRLTNPEQESSSPQQQALQKLLEMNEGYLRDKSVGGAAAVEVRAQDAVQDGEFGVQPEVHLADARGGGGEHAAAGQDREHHAAAQPPGDRVRLDLPPRLQAAAGAPHARARAEEVREVRGARLQRVLLPPRLPVTRRLARPLRQARGGAPHGRRQAVQRYHLQAVLPHQDHRLRRRLPPHRPQGQQDLHRARQPAADQLPRDLRPPAAKEAPPRAQLQTLPEVQSRPPPPQVQDRVQRRVRRTAHPPPSRLRMPLTRGAQAVRDEHPAGVILLRHYDEVVVGGRWWRWGWC